jgi:hypothetical protein
MVLEPKYLESAVRSIEEKYTGNGKFKSIAGMFTQAAMIDIGLMKKDASGKYIWSDGVASEGIKSYEDFLKASPQAQENIAKSYIEKANSYLDSELKRAAITDFDRSKIDESKLLESLFIHGARGTVSRLQKNRELFATTEVDDKNKKSAAKTPQAEQKPLTTITTEKEEKDSYFPENGTVAVNANNATNTNISSDKTKNIDEANVTATSSKTISLQEVTVRAKKDTVPGTGLTSDQAFDKVNNSVIENRKALGRNTSSEEDLAVMRKEYKKLGFSKSNMKKSGATNGLFFNIDEADYLQLNSAAIAEYGVAALYAFSKTEDYVLSQQTFDASIKDDRAVIKHNFSGKIPLGDQLYFALLAKFNGKIPELDDETKDYVKSGRIIIDKKEGEGDKSCFAFTPTDKAIDELLSFVPKDARNNIKGKEVVIKYNSSFSEEKYRKNIKHFGPALSSAGIKFVSVDNTATVMSYLELFGDLNSDAKNRDFSVAQYRRDFDAVNSTLPHFKGVGVGEYKRYYYELLARERQTYYAWTENNKLQNDSSAEPEVKANAKAKVEELKNIARNNLEIEKDDVKTLSSYKYKGNDDEIKSAIKLLQNWAKNDAIISEFDLKILDAKNVKHLNQIAADFDREKNKNDVFTLENSLNVNENSFKKLLDLADLPKDFKNSAIYILNKNTSQLSERPWVADAKANGRNFEKDKEFDALKGYINRYNLQPNPAIKAGHDMLEKKNALNVNYNILSIPGANNHFDGTAATSQQTRSIFNAGVSSKHDVKLGSSNFYTGFNTNANFAYISDAGDGKAKLYLPFEQNKFDYYTRQSFNGYAKFRHNHFNETSVNASLQTNAAVTSRNFSITHDHANVAGDKKTIGVQLPSQYEYSNGKISSGFGAVVGASGTVYLTDDLLTYKVSSSLSLASFNANNQADNIDNKLFLKNNINLGYNYGGFRANVNVEHASLAPFQEKNFNTLTTSVALKHGFNKISLSLNGTSFKSDNFEMLDIEAGISPRLGGGIKQTFSAGLTTLKLKLPGIEDSQLSQILKIGYEIGLKGKNQFINNTSINLDVSKQLNESNNNFPQQPFGIGIKTRF